MNVFHRCGCIVLLALTLPCVRPASGQDTDFKDLVSGNIYPLTMKMKDLNNDWRRFTATGGSATMTDLWLVTETGFKTPLIYFTKGQTVTTGGETYLITYRVPVTMADMRRASHRDYSTNLPEKVTGDTQLAMSLLNLKTCGSLNDIQSFDVQKELQADAEERSRELNQASENNLKQLGTAIMAYAQDYDEKFPPMNDAATFKKAVMPLVRSEGVFIHPETKELYLPNPSVSKKGLAAIAAPREVVMLYEPSPAPDGTRAVCFVDGHVKRIPEASWEKLKKASHIP